MFVVQKCTKKKKFFWVNTGTIFRYDDTFEGLWWTLSNNKCLIKRKQKLQGEKIELKPNKNIIKMSMTDSNHHNHNNNNKDKGKDKEPIFLIHSYLFCFIIHSHFFFLYFICSDKMIEWKMKGFHFAQKKNKNCTK